MTQSATDNCIGNPLCQMCVGSGCNNEISPRGRLQCHQCNSVTDPDCKNKQEDDKKLLPCRNYSADDVCVEIRMNSTGKKEDFKIYPESQGSLFTVLRGCKTEINNSDEICDEPGVECKFCNTEGCNKSNGILITMSRLCIILSLAAILFLEL